MKYFTKTMVAASALLAMIGCSKDWPFERSEDGKVEIEGGGGEEPEGGQAYPAAIYGTIKWDYLCATYMIVLVRDANGVCIGKFHWPIASPGTFPYNSCACSYSTESPLPWTVYAVGWDSNGSTWRMDSEVITSLDTWYNCPGGGGLGIRKKARQVDLNPYYPNLPDTTGYSCD